MAAKSKSCGPLLTGLLIPHLHCPDSTGSCTAGLASWFCQLLCVQSHWPISVSRALLQFIPSAPRPYPTSLPFHIPFSEAHPSTAFL